MPRSLKARVFVSVCLSFIPDVCLSWASRDFAPVAAETSAEAESRIETSQNKDPGLCSVSASEVAGFFTPKPPAPNETCAAAAEVLRDGDLVFLEYNGFPFDRLALTTNSWASHVGIAFEDPASGRWEIYESRALHGQKTPLCDYLGRTRKGHFAIRRYRKPLSAARLERIRTFATDPANYEKPYHLGFNLDSRDTSFCSKFAREAYRRADITIGRVESFREMLNQYRGDRRDELACFWDRWFFCRRDFVRPFCNFILGDDKEIPWSRRTVTPASELEDPRFETILEYPMSIVRR